jgi:hypothetical protein
MAGTASIGHLSCARSVCTSHACMHVSCTSDVRVVCVHVSRAGEVQVAVAKEVVSGAVAEADEAKAAFKQSDDQLRQLKDQYRRLQADFDNFRSRAVCIRAAHLLRLLCIAHAYAAVAPALHSASAAVAPALHSASAGLFLA